MGSTLYRVVAEGLTNAGRHGTGPVTLEISSAGPDRRRQVEVVITNAVPEQRRPRSGGGRGLTGVEERVELLGGTFSAWRTDDRRWCLKAVVPVERSR